MVRREWPGDQRVEPDSAALEPAWRRIGGTTECSLRARRRGRGPVLGDWRSEVTVHTSGYISYMAGNTRTHDYPAARTCGEFHMVDDWPGQEVVGRLLR